MAKGGTIFLDEVGEIPLETQVKLLRVLQERQIERVGGNQPMPVDIRLIAATHRKLRELVKEGAFREDLFYRLNVISIKIPPLRERKEDIPQLAENFLKKFAARFGFDTSFSEESLDELKNYEWPGNVRELENIVQRSVILSEGSVIDPEDLHLQTGEINISQIDINQLKTTAPTFKEQIQKTEVEELKAVLMKARGNVSEAARALNIPRTTLIHRMKKFNLI
jgi:transcriptional regulator with PAS, ATPase and Fis domain